MEINKPKVSVVIPVYNVELYLKECLDSIIYQTLKEIEIICVDDGSTDNSLTILQNYANKDDRIIIIEQENQGAGVARNTGLDIAKGEYLSFLDPDDFFELDMLEKLYYKAVQTSTDIVIFGCNTYNEMTRMYGSFVAGRMNGIKKENLPNKEIFSCRDMSQFIFNTFGNTAWNKLYSAEFIYRENVRFLPLFRNNDVYFNFITLALADKITTFKNVLLHYRCGMKNNSQSTLDKYPLTNYTSHKDIYEKLNTLNYYNDIKKSHYISMLRSMMHHLNTLKTYDVFKFIYDHLVENLDKDFNIKSNEDLFLENTNPYIVNIYKNYQLMLENDVDKYLELKEKYFINENDVTIKVSVIIPVYNTEKYLTECLESVVNQTLKNIEIICVNDGSNDSSIDILRNFANRDNRLVIINQQNQGQSVARNKGISIAKGKYIYFLDSDDMVVPYALERMYEEAVINDLDILYFDGKSIYESNELEKKYSEYKTSYQSKFNNNVVISGAEMFYKMNLTGSYRVQSCLYLTKTEFLKKERIFFPERIIHQDNVFMFKTILIANRVKHIKEELFIRRVRTNSTITQGITFNHFYGYLVCYIEMLDYANKIQYNLDVKNAILKTLHSVIWGLKNEFKVLSELEKNKVKNIEQINSNTFILIENNIIDYKIDNHISYLKSIGLNYIIPIPIVFICEECEIKSVVISIISLLENAKSSTKYLIKILHKEIYSTENIQVFNCLQEKYNNCKITHKQIDNDYIDNYIEIIEVITSNLNQLKKCIYLNLNVIVQKDLRELYEIELDNFGVGAVRELDNNEFNSSVLLLNIEKIIEQKNNYEITVIDLKYNLISDHLSEEKSFNFGSKIKLNPNLKTIYPNKVIKSALTENVIFNYHNNVTPMSNSECSFHNEWWKYFRLSPYIQDNKEAVIAPKITVILPVYNVENYLSECLDSIINQTLDEIEIICVNDGSSDRSLEILKEYSEFDKRIIVLDQENQGAGVARNIGLNLAKGEYLSFLDPDDFFELTMLEQVYNKAIENNVDIVVYDYYMYNDNNKVITAIELNSPTQNEVFSYKDMSDNIFMRLHHNAWTKLYKTKFVKDNNIKFQNLYRINDILFTHTASVIAKKITYLEKKLVYYRLGTKDSSQSTLHMYPLSFYEAELAIRDRLKELGYYGDVEQWFLNSLLDTMFFNLKKVIKTHVGEETYNYIRENLDKDFGITNNPKEFYLPRLYDEFMLIVDNSFDEYVIKRGFRK